MSLPNKDQCQALQILDLCFLKGKTLAEAYAIATAKSPDSQIENLETESRTLEQLRAENAALRAENVALQAQCVDLDRRNASYSEAQAIAEKRLAWHWHQRAKFVSFMTALAAEWEKNGGWGHGEDGYGDRHTMLECVQNVFKAMEDK